MHQLVYFLLQVCTFLWKIHWMKPWLSTFSWKLTGKAPVSIREGMQQFANQGPWASAKLRVESMMTGRHIIKDRVLMVVFHKGFWAKRRAKMLSSGSLQGSLTHPWFWLGHPLLSPFHPTTPIPGWALTFSTSLSLLSLHVFYCPSA